MESKQDCKVLRDTAVAPFPAAPKAAWCSGELQEPLNVRGWCVASGGLPLKGK